MKTWGDKQADVYEALLAAAVRQVSEHPLLGRPRDDVRPGLRGFVVGQHIVLYRVGDEEIEVLRVVHARRDISRLAIP